MRWAEPLNAYRPRKRMKKATVTESTSSDKRTRRGSDMNGMRSGAKRFFNSVSGEVSGEEDRLGPLPDPDRRSNENTMCRHTRAERTSAVMSIANTQFQPQSERKPVSSGPTAAPTIHTSYQYQPLEQQKSTAQSEFKFTSSKFKTFGSSVTK